MPVCVDKKFYFQINGMSSFCDFCINRLNINYKIDRETDLLLIKYFGNFCL